MDVHALDQTISDHVVVLDRFVRHGAPCTISDDLANRDNNVTAGPRSMR
jgi:hypothetical protein